MNGLADGVKREGLSLLQQTWFLIPNWKWMGLAVALCASFLLYHFLRWLLGGLRERIARRSDAVSFRAQLLREPLHGPLALFGGTIFALGALQFLVLPEGAHKVFLTILQILAGWSAIRLAYLAVNAGSVIFELRAKNTPTPLDDQLAPLISKTAKVLVVILGTLLILQNVGVNVVSILAGLGLGGLALALAAQDTAANLFGSITILFDRPFQIGDLIRVGDSEGTVEEIGLRSTRLRTAPRTVITVPNSIMAKEKIENLGVRPSRRIRHLIGVTYDTPAAKLSGFMDHIRYVILQHPLTLKEDVSVYFNSYGDSSLNILVNFYVGTKDWAEEQRVQQEILFQIMQIAEHNNVAFAFPTRTLHVVNAPAARALT